MATKKQIHFAKQGITKVRELEETLKEIDPAFEGQCEQSGMDLETAFQLYCQFTGDIEKTAHALNVKPVDVLRAADRLGWAKKLEAIFELKKSGRPGDVEKSLSRAISFVQAHRYRIVIERLLKRFYDMSDDELFATCFTKKTVTKKDGTVEETESVNCKPYADLATAMEKIQALCYSALGDTVTERAARKTQNDDSSVNLSSLHQIIASAMSGADPAAQLLQEQVAQADRPEVQ